MVTAAEIHTSQLSSCYVSSEKAGIAILAVPVASSTTEPATELSLPEQPHNRALKAAGEEEARLPFLLQSREVFFEGRADLVKQFHQGMTEKTGVCRFGIEVVCSRPARENRNKGTSDVVPETSHTLGMWYMTAFHTCTV